MVCIHCLCRVHECVFVYMVWWMWWNVFLPALSQNDDRFTGKSFGGPPPEQAYEKQMAALREARQQYRNRLDEKRLILEDHLIRLREREAETREFHENFRQFKQEIAMQAIYSRTGKKIPPSVRAGVCTVAPGIVICRQANPDRLQGSSFTHTH